VAQANRNLHALLEAGTGSSPPTGKNASLNTIIAALLTRANEILDRIEVTAAALRADLAGPRLAPRYLYDAAELIDHAADLLAQGAVLVHERERRWPGLLRTPREPTPEQARADGGVDEAGACRGTSRPPTHSTLTGLPTGQGAR
jgi:hypothetical protein